MRETVAPKPPSFAALVQQFFTEYLVAQRAPSPRTVACYRDALMLFLHFASRQLAKAPTTMRLADIQPDLILAFLDHLERRATPGSCGEPRECGAAQPPQEARLTAHLETYDRDAPVAGGRSVQRDRLVARSREPDDNPSLRRS